MSWAIASMIAAVQPAVLVSTPLIAQDCASACAVDAVVVEAVRRSGETQVCVANPHIGAYKRSDGGIVHGALVSAALDRPGLGKETRQLIIVSADPPADGFHAGELCAPKAILSEGVSVSILGASKPMVAFSEDFEAALASQGVLAGDLKLGMPGALTGFVSARKRPLLLQILFGYATSELVEIEVNSQPSGAQMIVNERLLPFRTNNLLAVPAQWLPDMTVRLKNVSIPLSRCQARAGDGRTRATFLCLMTQ